MTYVRALFFVRFCCFRPILRYSFAENDFEPQFAQTDRLICPIRFEAFCFGFHDSRQSEGVLRRQPK